MKKKPKIHVIRHKLQLDIEVDPASHASLDHAAGILTSVNAHVAGLDHTTMKIIDSRLVRVDAPKPAPEASEPALAANDPADDNLDIPERLRRTAETEPAVAE
ncbi:MAG TPA: hypothetical protein ENH89_00050 [Aurantimonas coralicida]|uniref:Uncharacterized protein n=1 Tax=Aurantimonas coralicida TaxID=182270 RepID=A0A9C9TEZ0_9HYPH|nr:hypothetical protein [Aurantimonas coralicida]